MDLVSTAIKMVVNTKDSWKMTISMVKVNSLGQMETSTREIGLMEECMAKVFLHTRMDQSNTRVLSSTERSTD